LQTLRNDFVLYGEHNLLEIGKLLALCLCRQGGEIKLSAALEDSDDRQDGRNQHEDYTSDNAKNSLADFLVGSGGYGDFLQSGFQRGDECGG
jgi:hypothetical protein